jgi:hypothetical protein
VPISVELLQQQADGKIRLYEMSPLQQPAPEEGQQQQTTPMPGVLPGVPPFGAELPTFAPGEEIKVRVRLQPYRTDAEFREFSVTVPDDFPSGSTFILVHGGGDLLSFSDLNGKGRFLFGMGPVVEVKDHDLDSILDQIIEWPMNNELLVTLARPFDPSAPLELGSMEGESADSKEDKVDSKYQTEWVIYNGFMLPVMIQSKEEQEKQKQMLEQMQQTEAVGSEQEGAKAEAEKKEDGSKDSEEDEEEGRSKLPFSGGLKESGWAEELYPHRMGNR